MSNLLAGLLSALISTNPAASVSNIVEDKTGASIEFINANDPVEKEYLQVLNDDQTAEDDIIKWSDNATAFAAAGAGDPKMTLDLRIKDRLDKVRKEYEDFLQRHPDHVKGRLAFGSFLNDTKDEAGAAEQWEKARVLDPKNPAAWNNLANYYGHRSPVKKSFEYYAKAIELNPKESVYYHNLATTVYLFRKDAQEYYKITEAEVFDKSLDLYRKAMERDPENFVLATDYAESFYGIRPLRLEEGLTAWKHALTLAHDETEREGVYLHLARLELRRDNYEEVRRQINLVTNPIYNPLKGRLTRNLDAAIAKAATNSPPAAK